MECDVCSRKLSAELEFYCVACARSTLYASRFESAKVLLAKEQLASRVEAIVAKGSSTAKDQIEAKENETIGLAHFWSVEAQKAQKRELEDRAQEAEGQAKILRNELAQARKDIAARKAHLESRKANLDSINARLPTQRGQWTGKISETMKKGTQSFDALHNRSIETRAFLCREVALLLRLKQKRKRKGDLIIDQYSLAGLPIADLKETYNMRCTDLTASISSVAHLLVLVSFYLSIRLPAEITLPHRDYPLPTISKPEDSWLAQKHPFPSAPSANSWNNSPTASRHIDTKAPSRPRPLFIGSEEKDERVVHVARKDTNAFNLFAEGVSLLAWDIAWVCRSQGMTSGTETWEEICDIGRNLWQLLLAPPHSAAVMQPASTREVPTRLKAIPRSSRASSAAPSSLPRLGEHSHASAHSLLGTSEAPDPLRTWKLRNPTPIFDALRKALVAEMSNAEWEMLQEDEWDDGGEQFDEAVFIKTRTMDGHEFDDARSIMTTRTRFGDDEEAGSMPVDGADAGKAGKGTSGWTRVKSREK